jgi:transposase-like protein
MEGTGKQRRPRRAFKAEIVEVCRRRDRTVGQVAKDFDLTETAARGPRGDLRVHRKLVQHQKTTLHIGLRQPSRLRSHPLHQTALAQVA